MPAIQVRGANLVYEVLGDGGPWVVISPGGRRGLTSDRALGMLLAEAGFRVLVYDRRNTGASDIGFPGTSESHEQAEDLLALLQALGTGPAYVAGCSSGARLSLLLALHHPEAVRALLLWRVTGGPYAARKLAFNYYEQFIAAAESGGIDAVARTEHFAAMIAANPHNRSILDRLGADGFVAAMRRWLAGFHQGSGYPVAGLSPEEMRRIALPALIVPGNDRIHPRAPGQAAHRLLPNSEYREIMTEDVDVDVDFAAWEAKTGTLAACFIDFLRRRETLAIRRP
ncbi:Pimeloyl-ACP methyl ester carboxylesterase [Enhydrobacter aerosaccus]|uniref:Pimeloyl-ACP methyl ester carboxylesterase n=1 Tax=Enhydrobacter aerosaccus TaxID=225324 RepID=A0A1T4SHZ4_9HYPH|nr:alpha/beta hydrolase [Enhydrobacter aerosaccus]SKA27776.1 Pimeloyl-ACP methyl ester carboxylesterase [Enhydrobacter aerosaccus]